MPRLRALAVRWMLWATVSRAGQDALRLGGRLVLARLLWPEAFGLFALAMVVIAVVKAGCQLEFSKSIVQRERLDTALMSTAFWSQAAFGAIGTVVLVILAGPLAALVGQPTVVPVIRVLGLQVLVGGVSAVPRALLLRAGAHRQLASRALLAEAAGAVAAIATVAAGGGVWGLVVQELVSDGVAVVVLWAIVPWRPRLRWSWAEFSELFEFGWPLLGKRALDVVAREGDRFLIGRWFGPEALGLYALGQRIVEALARTIDTIFDQVAFPTFARIQGDARRSRRGFLEALRFQALITVPLMAGIALVADDLVPFLLGARWTDAVPLTRVLAGRALAGALVVLPAAVLLGRGRSRRVLALGLVGGGLAALGWTAGLPWGPIGVAAGGLFAALVVVPIALWLMMAELPVRVSELGRALLPAALGGACMAAGIGVILPLVPAIGPDGRAVRLLAALLIGVVSFGLPLAPWLAGQTRRYVGLMREGDASRHAPSARFPGPGPD